MTVEDRYMPHLPFLKGFCNIIDHLPEGEGPQVHSTGKSLMHERIGIREGRKKKGVQAFRHGLA